VHVYATFELTGVQITSVQQGLSAGDVPNESVSMKFATLKETYMPEAKGDKPPAPTSYTFQPKA
jgi:hypothetical protein